MAYSTSTIAQGCFGKVYKEKYNDTWAAIKKVPHHLISKKDLERECDVYKWVKIPTSVKNRNSILFYFLKKKTELCCFIYIFFFYPAKQITPT